jgi:hypothetical protein
MSWTSAADIRPKLRRRWERGELLRNLLGADPLFPLRLPLNGPSSAELSSRFDEVRAWIAEISAVPRLRIEWREINHRLLGLQRVPDSIWVDHCDDALALLGKQRDAALFGKLVETTRSRQPALLAWLQRRPLQAIELADSWERLLAVTDWLLHHPRPGIYLRQVELPGIDTKFMEAHRGVLTELLHLALPPNAIDASRTGVSQFAARYGFLEKPERVRLRVLDARIALLPGSCLPDVTLDANSFARLTAPIRRVFITENETNFLAFPVMEGSVVIFGSGYGWESLSKAQWLRHCVIHYWGDIDTHGFAILDQLRSHFDHVESFLMDRETLKVHESLWGTEDKPVTRDLLRLTADERALFDALRDGRFRQRLRLEQERIGFSCIKTALDKLIPSS